MSIVICPALLADADTDSLSSDEASFCSLPYDRRSLGSCLDPLVLDLAGATRKGAGRVDELEASGFTALRLSMLPTMAFAIPRPEGLLRLLRDGEGPSVDGDVTAPVPSDEVHWGGVCPVDLRSGITADNL